MDKLRNALERPGQSYDSVQIIMWNRKQKAAATTATNKQKMKIVAPQGWYRVPAEVWTSLLRKGLIPNIKKKIQSGMICRSFIKQQTLFSRAVNLVFGLCISLVFGGLSATTLLKFMLLTVLSNWHLYWKSYSFHTVDLKGILKHANLKKKEKVCGEEGSQDVNLTLAVWSQIYCAVVYGANKTKTCHCANTSLRLPSPS